MRTLRLLSTFLLTVLVTCTLAAQGSGSLRKGREVSIPEKIHKLALEPLPAGIYSVGSGGYFPTIDSAFNRLSIDGVAGPVTLRLTDELYTAPTGSFGFTLTGPIPGAGPNSRVTLIPAENRKVTLEGNGEGVLYLLKTSYLTIDGVGITGPTTLTVRNVVNPPHQYNDAICFIGDCDHNVVQNTIALIEDITRPNSGVTFWPEANVMGTPDSNLIQHNLIKKATYGIYLGANQSQATKATGNIIRGNVVGSETDSVISCAGIQTERVQSTIIENNVIRNVKRQHLLFYEPDTYGVNAWEGTETIIRNNVIHNLSSDALWGIIGILLSGSSVGRNNMVYNNMICELHSTSNDASSRIAGIQIYGQVNPKIYYNSVYLSGAGNGANPKGSAALFLPTAITTADVRNNIFVNTRDESPYCASAVYDYTAGNLTSDYNDLYCTTSQYNCLVRIGSTDYRTLAEWQATERDLHSCVEMPHFVSSTDLHMNPTMPTCLESQGTPIAGIGTDFDGNTRDSTTPDIGADEFDGIVGVEEETALQTELELEQNYPNPFNPVTTISYKIPTQSHVRLKVFDVLGREAATLVNERMDAGIHEVRFDATGLSSGVYLYRLQAGDVVQSRRLILLR